MATREVLPDPRTARRLRTVIVTSWHGVIYHCVNFAAINAGALLLLLFSKRFTDDVFLILLAAVLFSSWCQGKKEARGGRFICVTLKLMSGKLLRAIARMLQQDSYMIKVEVCRHLIILGACAG